MLKWTQGCVFTLRPSDPSHSASSGPRCSASPLGCFTASASLPGRDEHGAWPRGPPGVSAARSVAAGSSLDSRTDVLLTATLGERDCGLDPISFFSRVPLAGFTAVRLQASFSESAGGVSTGRRPRARVSGSLAAGSAAVDAELRTLPTTPKASATVFCTHCGR